jgi:hypothetical protein
MTISTENIRNDYTGNGVTTTFPYTFKAFANNNVRVLLTDTGGTTTEQTLTTHYSLTGVGTANGGNVVFVTAPTNLYTVTILADIPITQTTDLVNETSFFQDRIETALDRSVRMAQILDEVKSRSLRLPELEVGSDTTTVLPALASRKGMTLAFDATTGQPTTVSTSTTAVSAAMIPVVQAATLALARSLLGASGSTSINPADYPYLADASGVAASDAAIQAAINALPVEGGMIAFPPGTFRLTDRIETNGKNVWFCGSGRSSTTLRQDGVGSAVDGIRMTGATRHLLVTDMTIKTNVDLSADNGQCGIYAQTNVSSPDNCSCIVLRCNITGFNFGVNAAGTVGGVTHDFVIVRDCSIRTVGLNSASVSEPVIAHNIRNVEISDNYLDCTSKGDHTVYAYHPVRFRCFGNRHANASGEAVKLIAQPSGSPYQAELWAVRDEFFTGCTAAVFVTMDGAFTLPLLTIDGCQVETGGGGGASAYEMLVQANSTSRIRVAKVNNNSFSTCQKGCIQFITSGSGAIDRSECLGTYAYNWSVASAGTYHAVSDSGSNLGSITAGGYFNGNSNGRNAFNLSVFTHIVYTPHYMTGCVTALPKGTRIDAGSAGATATASGVISSQPNVNVGTNADLLETTLVSYVMAANTMAINGQAIRIRAWGKTAANANSKTIRLKIGATVLVFNDVTAAPNNQTFELEAVVFRTSGSFVAYTARGMVGAVAQSPAASLSLAAATTGSLTLALTGQNGVATAGDVVGYGMVVEVLT